MEMSVNEVQLSVLEKRNIKLRRICDDYTKKIVVIKDVLEQLGCQIPVSSPLLITHPNNASSNCKVLQTHVKRLSKSKHVDV